MTNLFFILHKSVGNKIKNISWWPNYQSFEVVISVILAQNTRWDKVLKSLNNLKNINSIDDVLKIDNLNELIKPSGFYNTKAKRIINLCKNIKKDFGDFENFKENVDRKWLLSQKGIGLESADSILCYACAKEELVIDSYTLRILSFLGYEELDYEDAKELLILNLDINKAFKILQTDNLSLVYAYYHALFVEFAKEFLKGKKIDPKGLELLNEI